MSSTPAPQGLALVTGAGLRVGRAIALALGRAGFDLALHAHRSTAEAEDLAAQLHAMGRRARVHAADLSTAAGCRALVASVEGPLRALVCSAARYEARAVAHITDEDWDLMHAVNLRAPFLLTRGLLPALQASPDPCVLFIGDIGVERPSPLHAHYLAAKGGLMALTRALAVELAPEVRVNAVCPGAVAFPEGWPEAAREAVRAAIPMGREGRPEDVAELVVFLLTRAPWVTGQRWAVDGGASAPGLHP